MTKTVLITGAYGFIGRHTAHYFDSQGWNVTGVGHGDWSSREWQRWGIKGWYTADITLENLLTYAGEPDVIIHCAGSGSVGFSLSHPFQDCNRAVVSTLSVLEFARIHAPKAKVVFPSSAAVYGAANLLPITEDSLLCPVSPYGIHKKIAEELCSSYARFFNISVAIVRLFSVYGSGLRKQLLWDACEKLRYGERSFWGTGDETRDWIHVQDTASLLYAASEHASLECPVVNGGAGEKVSTRDVVCEIFKWMKRTDEPIFLGTKREGDPQHYQADIERLKQWKWKPKIKWQQGVREYAEWYIKEGAYD